MIPNMSLEELERLAYIKGDTATADLLGHLIDGDNELSEQLHNTQDQHKALERELDDAKAVFDQIAVLIGGIEKLVGEVNKAATEADKQFNALRGVIKAYRGQR